MNTVGTLRAVVNRLNSSPVEELPYIVGYLATSLTSCKALFQNTATKNDHGVLLHKLKTRVSSLLQDRSSEGRLAGIVVVKALVEAAHATILPDSGSWVRALISSLSKPDPPEIKKLAILTITRIHVLTIENPQLVREITTPTLPAFISATLNVIRPSKSTRDGQTIQALSPLLETVLLSWGTLIQHFSSTIRPNSNSFRSICLNLVSDEACPRSVQEAAHGLLAKLHFCAPKNNSATEWSQCCSQIIGAAHDTADLVLRAVIEDWTSVTSRSSKVTKKRMMASVPSTDSLDIAGLEPWSGVSQGCSRISTHLHLLQNFLTTAHNTGVGIPFGMLFDLTTRLSTITVPTAKYTPRSNSEITRDEREELWLSLPRIHTSILQLYEAMALVFGRVLYPLCNIILAQTWDIFEAEYEHHVIRTATYQLITSMLESRLVQFSRSDSPNVKLLVKHLCDDLRPSGQASKSNGISGSSQSNLGGPQPLELVPSKKRHVSTSWHGAEPFSSAYALLPVMLSQANIHDLDGSSSIRAELDTVAILLNHHEAILASVLYPPGSKVDGRRNRPKVATPSVIPFLARSADESSSAPIGVAEKLGYEALMRPRMPILESRTNATVHAFSPVAEIAEDPEDVMQIEDIQPTDRGQQTVASTSPNLAQQNTSVEPLSTTPSADSAPEPSGTKRDFTALLELSANAQLAASAAEAHQTPTPTPYPIPDQIEPPTATAKRQKRTEYHSSTPTPPNDNQPRAVSPTAATSGREPSPADAFPARDDRGDDTDSSDSEIPLIDATLVALSSSEDDDDLGM